MDRHYGVDMYMRDAENGHAEVVLPSPLKHSNSQSSLASTTSTLIGAEPEKGKLELVKPEHLAAAPAKPNPAPKPKASRAIRFAVWFNTYRKLWLFVITLNTIGLLFAILGRFPYAENHSGALVLGNLLAAIMVRNEIFGRFLYLFVNILFAEWTPLWFRLACTSTLQHLGGVHSGCAVSAVAWLLYKVVEMFINHRVQHLAILVTGVLTNLAVFISIASALPWVRNNHHNTFERWHRFFGWTGLAATWSFVILGNSYNPHSRTWDASAGRLLSTQELWFTIAITAFVLLPWVCVRKVQVEVEIPSSKVAVLKFKGGMQQGLLGRISRSAVMEYHAFGTISESMYAREHYMICGVQGDFTRGLVNDQPTEIWTRCVRFAGVGNTSVLYRRGIRVCTGTGLGAALSTCIQEPGWFLIWIGSDQEKTFGKTISNLIYNNIGPERRILWDSKKEGKRPDIMKLVGDAYRSWGAEVVMITSNRSGNDELMQGCRAAGIPAFGTLWDF
ncbi:hypothetical protein EXIGLDRAFT_307079 [Exidia glandulosa HHB12029]|uniref:Non-ribosomal peptide synthetase n=1 Tax=Exidia glandulosa HHB12029 TaxID=1314781 RepID=A0A165ZL17_EXIGL|nr:hypothetical protein EXIGLDRAFT_307079 [Exidia glandulosa HHB12029]